MFGIFGIRTYIAIGLALAIGVFGFFGYRYVTNLQLKNAQLETLTVTQSHALQTATDTIENLHEDLLEFQELTSELNDRLEDAEGYIDKLRETLSEHDLEYLALNKPGLIERIINDATDEVLDDFERISTSD